MKQVLEYVGTLLHLVGILLFVGGHIWFGFFTAMTERRKDREGAQFLALHLPFMANVFGVGVLLSVSSSKVGLAAGRVASLVLSGDAATDVPVEVGVLLNDPTTGVGELASLQALMAMIAISNKLRIG